MTSSGFYSPGTAWWTAGLHPGPGARWLSKGSTPAGQPEGQYWLPALLWSPSTIPFTRDVQTLYAFLERCSAAAVEGLEAREGPEPYSSLCTATLAQAYVLSKGSPEVSKMTLKCFQERGDSTQVLSRHFIRINTEGQQSVLLTSQLVAALTLLIGKRAACGVQEGNPFLFAKPDSSPPSHFLGEDCVRSYSRSCQAGDPERLTSARFHKHAARMFQILDMEDDELGQLAKLLGRDVRADREYYQSPEAAAELAKISKLLLAMEKGSLERLEGNSLEELELKDKLEPDAEQNSSGNAEEESEDSDILSQMSEEEEPLDGPLTPVQDALEHIKAQRDKGFRQEKFIDSFKGRGVFTNESIEPPSFVVEYRGEISRHEDPQRKRDTLNGFVFDFSLSRTNWSVDASAEDGSLGRLVNDDHLNPNCI
ncbi:uncharacterized protein ACNS7B_012415 isoform 1-T1 [Menidia menidia]